MLRRPATADEHRGPGAECSVNEDHSGTCLEGDLGIWRASRKRGHNSMDGGKGWEDLMAFLLVCYVRARGTRGCIGHSLH